MERGNINPSNCHLICPTVVLVTNHVAVHRSFKIMKVHIIFSFLIKKK